VNVLGGWGGGHGVIGPLGAAFTHQLSSFFVMLNSLRLLRVERARVSRPSASRLLERTQLPQAWERLRHVAGVIDFARRS